MFFIVIVGAFATFVEMFLPNNFMPIVHQKSSSLWSGTKHRWSEIAPVSLSTSTKLPHDSNKISVTVSKKSSNATISTLSSEEPTCAITKSPNTTVFQRHSLPTVNCDWKPTKHEHGKVITSWRIHILFFVLVVIYVACIAFKNKKVNKPEYHKTLATPTITPPTHSTEQKNETITDINDKKPLRQVHFKETEEVVEYLTGDGPQKTRSEATVLTRSIHGKHTGKKKPKNTVLKTTNHTQAEFEDLYKSITDKFVHKRISDVKSDKYTISNTFKSNSLKKIIRNTTLEFKIYKEDEFYETEIHTLERMYDVLTIDEFIHIGGLRQSKELLQQYKKLIESFAKFHKLGRSKASAIEKHIFNQLCSKYGTKTAIDIFPIDDTLFAIANHFTELNSIEYVNQCLTCLKEMERNEDIEFFNRVFRNCLRILIKIENQIKHELDFYRYINLFEHVHRVHPK